MNETSIKENILGTESIGKLLIKFAVPGVISLVVNSIYNIVDQIFIGQGVGYLGNGATNVIYPLTVLVLAIGAMLGDGSAAYMSLSLGKKEEKDAAKGVAFGLISTIIAGIIFCIVFEIFLEPICLLLGATENNLSLCLDYGSIIMAGVPFGIICVSYASIIRADGNPKLSMIGLLLGCAINIVFDPVFIFVFNMGVKGAAIATILGQIANAVLYVCYVLKKLKCVHIEASMLKHWSEKAGIALKLGISSFIHSFAVVVAIAIQNNIQVYYGALSIYGPDIPLSAIGVTMKVFMIVIAIVNGIASGAQPIYGYNYGSGRIDRVKKTYRTVFIAATIVLITAFAIFQLAPMAIVSIFGSSDELYNEFAVRTLRIYLCLLPIEGLQMVSGTFFQATGFPLASAITALSKQIIFMIPCIFILSAVFGIDGCLYVGPVTDVLAFILTVICVKIYWKKIFPDGRDKTISKYAE